MQVRKGNPPTTVERSIAVDLSRDEILSIVVNHIKTKLGPNLTFNDIQVTGDENDKLHGVTISGVEIVPLAWKSDEPNKPSAVTPAPVVVPVK